MDLKSSTTSSQIVRNAAYLPRSPLATTSDVDNHATVRANLDTLYSFGVFDLS